MRAIREHGPEKTGPRLVLLMLAMRLREGGDHVAWPAIATLAADCAMSPRAVQTNLRILEADGWLTIEKRGGRAPGDANGVANRYRINAAKLTSNTASAKGAESAPLANEGRRICRSGVQNQQVQGADSAGDQSIEQSREGQTDFSMKNGKVNAGVSAHARHWADAINAGKYVAPSAIRPSIAREMLAAGLVTESTLRERGISH